MSRMNVPQLWQKWLMMSAHTGGLLSSSRHGISPTDRLHATRPLLSRAAGAGERREPGQCRSHHIRGPLALG